MKTPETCDVCGEPLWPGQRFLLHSRLGAAWHAEHPLTNIKGEDVTMHTLAGGGVVPLNDRDRYVAVATLRDVVASLNELVGDPAVDAAALTYITDRIDRLAERVEEGANRPFLT
jgi:hypothetical protein